MKNLIKNIRINHIKRKIVNLEVSRDSYERWAEECEKPTACSECGNTVIGTGTSQRDNANYCKLEIGFLKDKLKELIK